MVRQILVAKTVDGEELVVQKASTGKEVIEIRELLRTAGNTKSFEVGKGKAKKECLYLELWARSGGVLRVVRLKAKSPQVKEVALETETESAN